jgi:hypothetical protein
MPVYLSHLITVPLGDRLHQRLALIGRLVQLLLQRHRQRLVVVAQRQEQARMHGLGQCDDLMEERVANEEKTVVMIYLE